MLTRSSSKTVIFRKLDRLPSFASIGIALAYAPGLEAATARRFRELATAVSE